MSRLLCRRASPLSLPLPFLAVRSETNAAISTLSTRVLTRLFFSYVRPAPLWANLAEGTAFIVHRRTQPSRNCGSRYGRDEYTTCISVKRWPRRRRQFLSKSSALRWTYKEGYVALEVRLGVPRRRRRRCNDSCRSMGQNKDVSCRVRSARDEGGWRETLSSINHIICAMRGFVIPRSAFSARCFGIAKYNSASRSQRLYAKITLCQLQLRLYYL